MKKRSFIVILFAAICCTMIYAQPHEHPDMTAYRNRNAGGGGGGIQGWNNRDGLGPVTNVHPTGATIGGGGSHYQTHISGWEPQDGLGPVVNTHNSGTNWGNNNNTNWGNNNSNAGKYRPNNNPSWNNNNWNNNWNNNSGWGNSNWGGSNWGGGISSSPIIVNNYYNPNYWWRDLRNPPAYSPISWGGNSYYYHDGNFFSILNGIYQVVLPVIGLVLQALPSGATQVTNYNNYYSYHGVFYKSTGNGYRVVPPPVGACLPSIPYFAQKVTINGVTCYKYDNVYIEPIYDNYDGDYCYRVVASVY